eukprot:TRINITY_DN13333_c1_g2_i1.p1 TRINITY_DN13333_c1_g2~~TRINITY_DN13333_c1_g2_i1.p1  ORF type:complete len:103 (+),score=9.22 TRINITY_DN13333_c1_g2_i1:27-311(+)
MLFFMIHILLTPMFSDEHLRAKAVIKMLASLLGIYILYSMDPTLFDHTTSMEPEPVKIVTRWLIYALGLDFVMFSMYLSLGFGRQKVAEKDKKV